jgi:hypothetical protein
MPGQGENSMGLEGQRKAYDITQSDFSEMLKERGIAFLGTATAFWGAADQYITALEARIIKLEQRNKDLETVVKAIGDDTPARPSPLEELGHVRGLDMLQWLYGNWQKDVSDGVASEFAGIRFVLDFDALPLECLVNRGYANNRQRAFWITVSGREYLKALKHDLRK